MARERRVRLVDAVGARRVDKVQLRSQSTLTSIGTTPAVPPVGLNGTDGCLSSVTVSVVGSTPSQCCPPSSALTNALLPALNSPTMHVRKSDSSVVRPSRSSLVVRRVELDQRVLQPLERLTLPRFDGTLRVGEQRVARNGAEAAARERDRARGAQARARFVNSSSARVVNGFVLLTASGAESASVRRALLTFCRGLRTNVKCRRGSVCAVVNGTASADFWRPQGERVRISRQPGCNPNRSAATTRSCPSARPR